MAQTLSLTNTPRQTIVVRLSGQDVRLEIWRQPSDGAWYADLDVPVGTRVLSGRRLINRGALLSRVPHDLPGDIWCLPRGAGAGDPGADPWGETHDLVYVLPSEY